MPSETQQKAQANESAKQKTPNDAEHKTSKQNRTDKTMGTRQRDEPKREPEATSRTRQQTPKTSEKTLTTGTRPRGPSNETGSPKPVPHQWGTDRAGLVLHATRNGRRKGASTSHKNERDKRLAKVTAVEGMQPNAPRQKKHATQIRRQKKTTTRRDPRDPSQAAPAQQEESEHDVPSSRQNTSQKQKAAPKSRAPRDKWQRTPGQDGHSRTKSVEPQPSRQEEARRQRETQKRQPQARSTKNQQGPDANRCGKPRQKRSVDFSPKFETREQTSTPAAKKIREQKNHITLARRHRAGGNRKEKKKTGREGPPNQAVKQRVLIPYTARNCASNRQQTPTRRKRGRTPARKHNKTQNRNLERPCAISAPGSTAVTKRRGATHNSYER